MVLWAHDFRLDDGLANETTPGLHVQQLGVAHLRELPVQLQWGSEPNVRQTSSNKKHAA